MELLHKTIVHNKATAALELELKSMRHKLKMQKLHHEKAMLSKDLKF